MDHIPLHVDGPWTFIEGVHEGRPMIVRLNAGLRSLIASPRYPLQVGVALPLHSPRENGMPGVEESAELQKIEDALFLSLLPRNESLFAISITTNGVRELVYYTSNDEAVMEKVRDIREATTSHEVQLMIRPDREWAVYRRFARGTQG